ncbi:MAG TPA: hypothetical protein VGN72_21295 [Tepidisphaeraceae bacterium]|nr:hypothetical protein [Tepidisphaeraceae bacterium]
MASGNRSMIAAASDSDTYAEAAPAVVPDGKSMNGLSLINFRFTARLKIALAFPQ